MPADLDQAYRQTLYQVQAGQYLLCYKIAQYDTQAEAQLINCVGAFSYWAIITACNPYSVALCQQESLARQEDFQRWLNYSGYRWLPGCNHDPLDAWPDEPAALILDIPLAEARQVGCRLNQNAIVFARLGSAPKLIWLRDP